ncbi:hypothetical protein BSL78_20070 [Apostichopus japonicus]|uniref:Ig-like domain-containing protein n=1 Tax=Stichopus japonicus TaxID=307972 RepID=A0A2G8K4Y4_STIJA|nr:hypothetical protein BSL78_20070 [Apostichopus japonicus]
MDGEYNEVVFVGETDITLRCLYNGNLNVDTVTIMDQNGNIVTEEIKTICAEYRINTVAMSDGGMYKCYVRSTYMDRTEVTEVATLDLNVKYDTSPQCFRNGTVGDPYKPGDWILLSCYCKEIDMCLWSSTVIGSTQADPLPPLYEMVIHKGKAIRRVIVHYTSSTDNNTRYDCFSGSASTDRCEIGPRNESSNDTIINSMETVTSTDVCSSLTTEGTSSDGIILEKTTVQVTAKDTTAMDDSSSQNNDNPFVIVIVTGVSAAGLLAVVVVFLIVFIFCGGRKKANRKVKDNKMANDDHKADYLNGTHLNGAYQQTSTEGISNDDSHTYDSPPMKGSDVISLPDDNYAELDQAKLSQMSSIGTHGKSDMAQAVGSDFQGRPIPLENREAILDNKANEEENLSMLYAKIDKTKRKSNVPGNRPVSTTPYAMVDKNN